ncbi:MAG: SAF domain-containing protein [Cellulomonadaceae bacterium]
MLPLDRTTQRHPRSRPRPRMGPARRHRLRELTWRWRFMISALALGVAAAATVAQLRPAPLPTSPVVVLRTDVVAGEPVTERHVRLERHPSSLVPDGALGRVEDVADMTAAVPLPAGTVVSPGLLAGTDVTAHAPPGTVVAPVRLTDPAVAALLRSGDRVDLILVADASQLATGVPADADLGPPAVLAERALVLPLPSAPAAEEAGLLDVGGSAGPDLSGVVLVAVSAGEALNLVSSVRLGHIGAVIVE